MAKKAKSAGGAETGGVDLEQVKQLLAFMEENGLEEFEYEKSGVHIRLKKASAQPVAAARPAASEVAHSRAPHLAPSGPAPTAPREPAKEAHDDGLHVVKSPIVGTFYARPSPEAEAFVTVGAKVDPGQVLCIIEAMKLMNEIESDVAGEIVQVFVENGHPVEYGQPLFGIRPRGKK